MAWLNRPDTAAASIDGPFLPALMEARRSSLNTRMPDDAELTSKIRVAEHGLGRTLFNENRTSAECTPEWLFDRRAKEIGARDRYREKHQGEGCSDEGSCPDGLERRDRFQP